MIEHKSINKVIYTRENKYLKRVEYQLRQDTMKKKKKIKNKKKKNSKTKIKGQVSSD